MSCAAAEVLAAFEALPAADKEVVVSELRRVAQFEHQASSDQELTAAADQMFQALDRGE
jgi:hypothetical protein